MLIFPPSQLVAGRARAQGCAALVIIDYLMLSMQVGNLFLCNQDQTKSSPTCRCLKNVCSHSMLYLAGRWNDLPSSLLLRCV